MSDLVILRYTEETPLDSVYEAFINLKKAVPNKTVVATPYFIYHNQNPKNRITGDCILKEKGRK